MSEDLALPNAAPQQRPGPRPLPLFLAMVRDMAASDPAMAAAALDGLRRFQETAPALLRPERPAVARRGGACLRSAGGKGAPILLIPSLINPPTILDLDSRSSLAEALTGAGEVLLLDWGPASARAGLDLSGHVRELLLPLLDESDARRLVGYCLGGTLALAAAALRPSVSAVATLASPWQFSAYPDVARASLATLWQSSRATAAQLGGLPMEVLQSAFWSLDPARTVAKFARFAAMEPGSVEAVGFVALEEWANGGEPLPVPAARELVEDFFGRDLPGAGTWLGGARATCPQLHVTAAADRIVPAASAAAGERLEQPSGHVGMIVGRQAPTRLHVPLRSWLEGGGRGG